MKPAVEDIYPLAPVQQGMLFHTLADPDAGYYVNQADWQLTGQVDVAAFEKAWRQVSLRHPALRSCVVWQGQKEPLQVVRPAPELEFEQLDWTLQPAQAQAEAYARLLVDDRRRGFVLAKAPLMRSKLIRTGASTFRFLWTHHHLIMDGWSLGIVMGEVLQIYQALRQGKTPVLPAAPRFRGFIDWIRKQPAAPEEAHWRKVLAPFDAPTPLGVDRAAAPTRAGNAFGERPFELGAEVTGRLRALADRNRATLSSVVHGAWALLLARYSGSPRVLFGAVFAGRPMGLPDVESMVGCFMSSLPVALEVDPRRSVNELVADVQAHFHELKEHEHGALVDIQKWSKIPPGRPLFESMVVFENFPTGKDTLDLGFTFSGRVQEQTNYPITIFCGADAGLHGSVNYDGDRVSPEAAERLCRHLETLLTSMAAEPGRPVGSLAILPPDELDQVLRRWNQTDVPVPELTVHAAVEAQVDRTPDAVAAVFRGAEVTFAELDGRANQLAHRLGRLGVRRGDVVALCVERSDQLLVGLLGILKAGAAYLPMDPAYPSARLAWMLEDSRAGVIVTEPRARGRLRAALPADRTLSLVTLGDPTDGLAEEPTTRVPASAGPGDLAYLIYTSGSTGRPKGVLVPHRQVASFFEGMDARVGHAEPRVWAAVTSISFDISVLELFWTLARGFKVIVHPGEGAAAAIARASAARPVAFSLYYFASDDSHDEAQKYKLLLDGARFADERGFAAVWTPERHFHQFGGLFPNPSVVSAALAAITRRVQIRAGSVVAPLHSPVRIAEEWSVVDNLSGGRVGIAFASGWHPDDFVFAPENFAERRARMAASMDTVRRLWRGEAVPVKGGTGEDVEVRIRPRPIQPELPVWITSAGSVETFELAGRLGVNLLTHLLGQQLADLGQRIERYRAAWRSAGHPGQGQVTLMLHTFVGRDLQVVKDTVREPFLRYLRSSLDLLSGWVQTLGEGTKVAPSEMDGMLEQAFDRYFETAGLFGTPDSCLEMVERIRATGVDELACLIDFGVETRAVLESLELLDEVRLGSIAPADAFLPQLMKDHGVGYLQCTPSLARALVADEQGAEALRPLTRLLVGGEALPEDLARELRSTVSGQVLNMYGPTETTVWSTSSSSPGADGPVRIGAPIANTRAYVLDAGLRPMPVEVDGELYLGGEGVVDGYWRRPELTAERFVPEPFSGRPGARMYRTGDRARWSGTGQLEFRGRVDHQLKIRGHRIEPGEIEAVLERHPEIKQALVVGRGEATGVRLVAYLVARTSRPSAAVLRDFVRRELPDYMVPAAFGWLDALPLTPNGKVDRAALPDVDGRSDQREPTVEPGTPTEQMLAEIFTRVLQRPGIGIHDNFFELGGDSLLAIQITSQVRKAGHTLTPGAFFQYPTIAELARQVKAAEAPPPAPPPVASAAPKTVDYASTGMSPEELARFVKRL